MTLSLSRRSLLTVSTAAAAGVLAAPSASRGVAMEAAELADPWRLLVAGNERFVAGRQAHPHQTVAWRQSLVTAQHPFACVLGCADSRVPPELLFDRGLGDLFTVRAIGEVLDDAVVGSIEYAVEHLAVPLVVVLGHTGCGAVRAAIDLLAGGGPVTGAVSVVARAIEATVRSTTPTGDEAAFLAACVRNQAKRVRTELIERSAVLATAVRDRQVDIVSAVYDLGSGSVDRLQ